MLEYIEAFDKKWLLAINHNYSPQWDGIMWFASQTESWIPLYILLAALLVFVYKKDSLLMILMILPLVLATDQISSAIIRPLFMRPRPSHTPGLEYMLHYVKGYQGGSYGFISSHSCNTFGLATYLTIVTFRRLKWMPFLVYPWAMFVCYSRMYLGVHFPTDIIVAAFLGMFIAWLISRLYYTLKKKGIFDIVQTPTGKKINFTPTQRKENTTA